jgi:hypothetical protein
MPDLHESRMRKVGTGYYQEGTQHTRKCVTRHSLKRYIDNAVVLGDEYEAGVNSSSAKYNQ